MKRPDPVFHAFVGADGRVSMESAEASARQRHLRELAGSDGARIDMIFRLHKDVRSEQANAYYWFLLTFISKETSEGNVPAEAIHDEMCKMFIEDTPKRFALINRLTGEEIAIESDGRRSSKLKGDEFYTFVENVRQWAREWLKLETPSPDPAYWRKRASKAA